MTNVMPEKLTVFLYHDICDKPSRFCKDYNLSVSIKNFKKQIEWIDKKFNIISPNHLIDKSNFPRHSALITFDDGFLGAYKNGIKFLIKNKIPSLMFLNMEHIINNSPLISSRALFYQKFCKELNFENSKPLHLTINPNELKKIENRLNKNYTKEIIKYQGRLADYETVKEFAKNKYVHYGNHLYKHWNSPALKKNDFIYSLRENEKKLKEIGNCSSQFAFPNGVFNNDLIKSLKKIGFKKIFYSAGKTNFSFDDFLLDRIPLTDLEYNSSKMNILLLKSNSNNFLFKKIMGVLRRF